MNLDEIRDELREVRFRYDKLPRGATARLRRCRSGSEVRLEPIYWQVAGKSGYGAWSRWLPHVVLLYPLADQLRQLEGFRFGRYLRHNLRDNEAAQLRFRRLLASRDQDELSHRLRGLLRLAAANRAPVDWGGLGLDIVWFFAESDNVRRRWAQDFYAPITSATVPSFDSHSNN